MMKLLQFTPKANRRRDKNLVGGSGGMSTGNAIVTGDVADLSQNHTMNDTEREHLALVKARMFEKLRVLKEENIDNPEYTVGPETMIVIYKEARKEAVQMAIKKRMMEKLKDMDIDPKEDGHVDPDTLKEVYKEAKREIENGQDNQSRNIKNAATENSELNNTLHTVDSSTVDDIDAEQRELLSKIKIKMMGKLKEMKANDPTMVFDEELMLKTYQEARTKVRSATTANTNESDNNGDDEQQQQQQNGDDDDVLHKPPRGFLRRLLRKSQ